MRPQGSHTTKSKAPRANVARPNSLIHWPRFAFWRLATPLHPYLRDVGLKLGLINFKQFLDHKGRQRFVIGMLRSECTLETLITHLAARGYGDNVVAWQDNGEVASLRLPDGFRFQYHIRIFDDGEVRGHYEYTPEAHPLKHYYEVDMEERREYFLELLQEHIEPRET